MGKRKTENLKAKEPIKIRFKKLANGNLSICLARWNSAGDKWEYEFLKDLYIVPDNGNANLKDNNEQTMKLANAIHCYEN